MEYYDWEDDLYTVSGALSDEKSCLEIPQEYVDDLIWRAAEIEYADCLEEDPEFDEGADEIERIDEWATDFRRGGSATLWAIPLDSKLYDLLVEWYDGDEDKLAGSVRSHFTDDAYMFFATGMGYDVMSADLLGGTSDGVAHREFDRFVEERKAE